MRYVPTLKIHPELRAELDRIEEFLMGPKGGDLAVVLSALRGPDEDSLESSKYTSTTHVRAESFPRIAAQAGIDSNFAERQGWSMLRNGGEVYVPGRGHFSNHIFEACRALGIPCTIGKP